MVSFGDVFLFWSLISFLFVGLVVLFVCTYRLSQNRQDPSPFTGTPLRYGREIGFFHLEKIGEFLQFHESGDNRLFNIQKASFCRDTGRIFPNTVTWLDTIRLPRDYIQKRLTGSYVSWGSLTSEQKQAVRKVHSSLIGFQTDYSSQEPSPRLLRPEFALMKPGPLYVDIHTFTLIGWKEVPETPFEILIVQRPLQLHFQTTA